MFEQGDALDASEFMWWRVTLSLGSRDKLKEASRRSGVGQSASSIWLS